MRTGATISAREGDACRKLLNTSGNARKIKVGVVRGMNFGDTSLGGRPLPFPETSSDVVAQLKDASPTVRRAGFDELSRGYWRPVYQYLRVAGAKSNEDAKDLAQAFFLWLMEGDLLSRYDPHRAGFRPYLKGLLRNFLLDKEDALRRLKHGGGVRHVSLESGGLPLEACLSEAIGTDPEKAFDQSWRKHVLACALTRVKAQWASVDQSAKFRVFEEYYLPPGRQRPTYAAVAGILGIKESDVLHSLAEIRTAVREEVRRELSAVTQNSEEMEEEWRAFFGE